jgi:hypothetical protein
VAVAVAQAQQDKALRQLEVETAEMELLLQLLDRQ